MCPVCGAEFFVDFCPVGLGVDGFWCGLYCFSLAGEGDIECDDVVVAFCEWWVV